MGTLLVAAFASLMCPVVFCVLSSETLCAQTIFPPGPVLLIANHQSFFDPIIVGIGPYPRPFYSIARHTLWNNKLFGWLMTSLNAIPVDQNKGDLTAMRRCLEVLNGGRVLLIFPEGARTEDGKTNRFATGTMMLIKRSRATILPIAIEGAYDLWPRGKKWPALTGHLAVNWAQPIPANELIAMGNVAAMEHLRSIIERLRLEMVKDKETVIS